MNYYLKIVDFSLGGAKDVLSLAIKKEERLDKFNLFLREITL